MTLAALSLWGTDVVGLAKTVIIIAAIVAVVYIALRVCGISVPPWLVQIFWVLVAAFVAVAAVTLLASL